MVAPVDHAIAGETKTLGTPIKLSKTPGGIRSAAPALGQPEKEVRAEAAARQSEGAAE
jgi:formyl-CoA transferase